MESGHEDRGRIQLEIPDREFVADNGEHKAMMKFLLALSVMSGLVPAQITSVAPATVHYRLRSPKVYPTLRYVAPPKQVLVVAAAQGQAWQVQVDGALTSGCTFSTSCIAITGEYDNNPVTGGTGPARVAVNWYSNQMPEFDPGAYTGDVSFIPTGGGTTIVVHVILNIAGASALPASAELKATALLEAGCANESDATQSYTYSVQCDIPLEAPTANPALTQPAVGASFIDPTFGGRITRITPPGCSTEYGTTTAFSANSTYILTSCGVYRRSDAVQIRSARDNISYVSMSATDDEAYYFLSGSTIRKYNFVTDTETVLGDYSGAPYGFTTLYAGGTASASGDNWLAFYEYSAEPYPKICAVNLVALEASGNPAQSNTYCANYTGNQGLSFLDWVSVSDVDAPTEKRYVYLSAVPLSVVFSVGAAGVLTEEYIVPEWPGWARNNDDGVCTVDELCYNASNFTHNAIFKDRDGQVQMFGNFQDIFLNRNYNSIYRLSAGLNVLRPDWEGGGLTLLGRVTLDDQPGCSSSISGCVYASTENGARFAARVMGATIQASATELELSASPGWATGSMHPVLVQNGAGTWSCLNGEWTGTVTSDTVFEIPANCAGASGNVNAEVMLGDAAQPWTGSQNNNRSQIQIWRPERQIHRIAMHRSVAWNDVPGTGISPYGSTPRASISRDGRYVAFNSNWGALDFDGVSVYIVETGLGAPEDKVSLKTLAAATNAAVLSYDLPSGAACDIEVSADPTFQNPVEVFTDDAGSVTRSIYLGRTTPLTPATNYWMRMQCGLEIESRSFRTMDPTAPVVKTIITEVGSTNNPSVVSVVIKYRTAGEESFTTTPLLACGPGCLVSWSGIAGTLSEYKIVYLDASATVVSESEIHTLNVLP